MACNNYYIPAMDYNGVVASLSLNFGNVINHSNHILHVRKLIPSSPIGDVELAHLMSLNKLLKIKVYYSNYKNNFLVVIVCFKMV